eukprot:tig00020710_g13345.t1
MPPAVREAIAEDFKRFSWKRIATRRAVRVEYIQWRTRMLLEEERGNEAAAAACQAQCQRVEDLLTYPDVIYYRNIAELEVLRMQKRHGRNAALDSLFSLARADRMEGLATFEAAVGRKRRSAWKKIKGVLTLGLAKGKKRSIASSGSGGSLQTAPSQKSQATQAIVESQHREQEQRLGRASMEGGPPSTKLKGRRLTLMDKEQRERLLAECHSQARPRALPSSCLAGSCAPLLLASPRRARAELSGARTHARPQAELAALVEGKLRQLNPSARMSEEELQEYLQDVIYPEFFVALQQRRTGAGAGAGAGAGRGINRQGSFVEGAPGTVPGAAVVKVRVQLHVGTAAFLLLERPRKRLIARRGSFEHTQGPHSPGRDVFASSSGVRRGSTAAPGAPFTQSMTPAREQGASSRGWRRLRALLGTLLERTPGRDPRHRLCRIEISRVRTTVELRGARTTIVALHTELGGVEIRDLTYTTHWPVLITPMKSDRYFETAIDPQQPRVTIDVQGGWPLVRVELARAGGLFFFFFWGHAFLTSRLPAAPQIASGSTTIAIRAHHMKAVYSRFMTTLVYFVTPPRPNMKQRIFDPKFADVRQVRSEAVRSFG